MMSEPTLKQDRSVKNVRDCARLRHLDWAESMKLGDRFHEKCRKDVTQHLDSLGLGRAN